MNSPDWLRRLPSVNEILDKPPLRAVVEKWNRSAVAGRVRSFLEEIREEVQARTGDISVSELAERAARYVLGPARRVPGVAINATGRLWGEPWRELPIADEALHAATQAARDFNADTAESGVASGAEQIACQLTGADAAVVMNSQLGALEITLRALAAHKSVTISRGEIVQLSRDCRLTDLVAAAGARLLEVGAIDATTANDFAHALLQSPSAILRIEHEDRMVLDQRQRPTIAEAARVAAEAAIPLIVDLGRNPLIDGLPTDGRDMVSAQQALAEGASLVVVRTDGFIGGLPAALLLGDDALVRQVKSQPLFAAHRVNGLASATLAATLEFYRDPDRARFNVPLLSLVDTPLENLRTRAERLAPQMAESAAASAEAVSLPASSHAAPAVCRLPSWGIALTPRSGTSAALVERLSQVPYPVVGRLESDRFVLDLRTVFPRQDLDLVSAITGN